jgi:hypothetical protein
MKPVKVKFAKDSKGLKHSYYAFFIIHQTTGEAPKRSCVNHATIFTKRE